MNKNVIDYINEANTSTSKDEEKAKKLEEKIASHQAKIDKIQILLDKKVKAFEKLIDSYKKNTELCKLIPFEIFNNFKWISYKEQQELEKQVGHKIIFPFNPAAGDMYYKKGAEIRLRHGITPDTPYKGNEDKFKAADDDPENELLDQTFYWDYFTKCNELVETIHKKESEIKELQEKVITVSDEVKKYRAKAQRTSDLFEQVPQLAEFIEEIGKKQYEFYIEQNEKLKKLWDKYNAEVAKLDKKYGDEWAARCNRRKDNGEGYNKYVELKKLKPKNVVRTEAEIKRWVDEWKKNERALMAERITTEFGTVKSATLHQGADGNVNGVIVGTEKTATIDTIFAGGYNIQCLHTRLLVHER